MAEPTCPICGGTEDHPKYLSPYARGAFASASGVCRAPFHKPKR